MPGRGLPGQGQSNRRVDYDRIAATYDRRYEVSPQPALAAWLRARGEGARRVLEAGCGTGRWLADLAGPGRELYGLDFSAGMLAGARRRGSALRLARGTALRLPFPSASLDLVYCVNALHHFGEPRAFVAEACRLLRPGGALAVLGSNPRDGPEQWYVYHYFEGAFETDLARFTSWGTLVDWMLAEGLEDLEWHVLERIEDDKVGRAVLDDPFLAKNATSQLTLLSDEAYAAGLARIEADLAAAEARGQEPVFRARIIHSALLGRRPA